MEVCSWGEGEEGEGGPGSGRNQGKGGHGGGTRERGRGRRGTLGQEGLKSAVNDQERFQNESGL